MLLNSCATPPARRPIASIFWRSWIRCSSGSRNTRWKAASQPTWIRSPSLRSALPETRAPFSQVPFLLPRSSRRTCSGPESVTRAWSRETRSSSITTDASVERPITSSPVSGYAVPLPGPCRAISTALRTRGASSSGEATPPRVVFWRMGSLTACDGGQHAGAAASLQSGMVASDGSRARARRRGRRCAPEGGRALRTCHIRQTRRRPRRSRTRPYSRPRGPRSRACGRIRP